MDLNNNIISLEVETPQEVMKEIAGNVKLRRLEKNITQEGLAKRAGIKLPTYRRFEQNGEISLLGLIRIGWALGMTDDFKSLFVRKQYDSFEEAISKETKVRKRGKRK